MHKPVSVRDVMSSPTYFVEQNMYLEQVDASMQEQGVSALAITDAQGGLVGVISRSDLIHSALSVDEPGGARALVLPDVPAAKVMTPNPMRVAPGETLARAAMLMWESGVHRIFVTEADQLAGVVAMPEVMAAVRDENVSVPLSSCMTKKLVSVQRDQSVRTALDLIAESYKHGLLVENDGHPVGILTMEELLLAQHWPATFSVEEFMYRRPLCLPMNMPLHRAAAIALANKVRHIVVLDEHGAQGMVTSTDFAHAYAHFHAQ